MRRILVALFVLALVHELLARWLDGAELIERLLAPGPGAVIAIPAALVFYVLRLGLVFLGPGIALASVVFIAVDAWTRRGSSRRSRG